MEITPTTEKLNYLTHLIVNEKYMISRLIMQGKIQGKINAR